jgi:predicted RND superfamily exporter protein
MGIAISAGLLSATILTLVILPANLMIIDDIRRALSVLWNGDSDHASTHGTHAPHATESSNIE